MISPLTVVVVAAELPYPPNAGNRIRTWNLIRRLARRHHITFLAHRHAEADQAAAALATDGINSILVDQVLPPKTGPQFYARLAANLVSPRPFSVASLSSRSLQRAARELAAQHHVDLWQIEAIHLFDTLDGLESAPKVVIAHNVESLIWQRYYETESWLLKRWYIKQQWRKLQRFERRILSGKTSVVAVTAEDARLMRTQFGGTHVEVVDNGIDRDYFEAVEPSPKRGSLLFLGSLDWRPNLDALSVLLDRIFPAVCREELSARLLVVGRKPPESLVRRLDSMENVTLHANVPDVRPFLSQSSALIVPLRIGGGSRLKILEALASGLPVISTQVGAEGLDLEPGRDYISADDPEAMVRAIIRVVRDPQAYRTQTDVARRFVLDRYNWDNLALRLEQVWYRSCHARFAEEN